MGKASRMELLPLSKQASINCLREAGIRHYWRERCKCWFHFIEVLMYKNHQVHYEDMSLKMSQDYYWNVEEH